MKTVYTRNYDFALKNCLALKDKILFNLFLFLLFPHAFDKQSEDAQEAGAINGQLIPQFILAKLEGKQKELRGNNYTGQKFLDRFSKDVFPIKYSKWYSATGLCRIIVTIQTPAWVSDFVEYERDTANIGAPRCYTSGRKVTDKTIKAELIQDRQDIQLFASPVKSPIAGRLIEHMNNLPVNTFTTLIKKNMPEAVQYAENIQIADRHKIRNRQLLVEQQTDILAIIREQPIPLYQAVTNSSRIYPANQHLASVDREIRHILTQGNFEADLKSAQLAIAAKVWNMPDLQLQLKRGLNIWEYLLNKFPQCSKDWLKQTMYALLYCMPIRDLKLRFKKQNVDFQRFTQDNIISEILYYRERMTESIKNSTNPFDFSGSDERGGMLDAWGNWISLTGRLPRSVLAEVNQSYELKLLEPIIELAFSNKLEMQILLFQHDGLSFSYSRSSSRSQETMFRHMQMLIEDRARELDIHTKLEIKLVVSPLPVSTSQVSHSASDYAALQQEKQPKSCIDTSQKTDTRIVPEVLQIFNTERFIKYVAYQRKTGRAIPDSIVQQILSKHREMGGTPIYTN